MLYIPEDPQKVRLRVEHDKYETYYSKYINLKKRIGKDYRMGDVTLQRKKTNKDFQPEH